MIKVIGLLGALFGGLSVALGAFGAHALRSKVENGVLEPRMLEVWQTAASYQMYHALALLAVTWVLLKSPQSTSAHVAGVAFIVGVTLFSGSLYTMVLSGIKWLGAITPIGGVAFMVGWAALGVSIWKILK